MVLNSTPQKQIQLQTNLQAVAVEMTLHRPITICSLYLPPNMSISVQDLENLTQQLPEPYLLVGDFNSHNPMWGSATTNNKGNVIEKLIDNLQLCLLNDKSPTYLHPASGNFSCIDLTLSHPLIYLDYNWSVLDDQYGSDHFPLLLTSNTSVPENNRTYYKFSKADWEQFNTLCSEQLNVQKFTDCSDICNQFTTTLSNIANKCIPKTSKNPSKKQRKPWFNEECKISARKR